jgi:hypothetical protein
LEARLRRLLAGGILHLPRPGAGSTWSRFRRLAEFAAEDLSLARLAEGHCDAIAILAEAGLQPESGSALYGVWVAGPPLTSNGSPGGELVDGRRGYCSGSTIVDRALVTSRGAEGGVALFEIDAKSRQLQPVPDSWPAVGMAATSSHTISFSAIRPLRQVGPIGYYEDRPGFWNGSANVAACWYGGALGLARALRPKSGGTAFERILRAELNVLLTRMRTVLAAGAGEIDACPNAPAAKRELRALRVRDMIYRDCMTAIGAAGELGGTDRITHDVGQAKRLADLPVYLRQHHPMPDRERIGRLLEEQLQGHATVEPSAVESSVNFGEGTEHA